MGDAAQYKKNAEECRALARGMPRPEDRAVLDRMAQGWDQLAAEAKRKRKDKAQG